MLPAAIASFCSMDTQAIAYHSRTIRLPVYVHNLLYTVRRTRKTLMAELGRTPTETELADAVRMLPLSSCSSW